MDEKTKYMMYYFDSKVYNQIEIVNNLQRECEKHFCSRKAEIDITLNEFGTYIATLVFKDNQNKFTTKKKKKVEVKKKNKAQQLQNNKLEKKYGAYKQTGTFRPI